MSIASRTHQVLIAALAVVVLVAFLGGICIVGVDAAALSTSITAGSTSSVDDSTSTFGTTLQVLTMLSNAAGPEGALFDATRLIFAGSLKIKCPTTAPEWSKPLTVIIRDGQTNPVDVSSWPYPYIDVSGILAYNSSITVEGGLLGYSRRFINSGVGFTIQDYSTFLITGGTFNLYSDGGNTNLFTIGSGLIVKNGSSITISNNLFVSVNVSASSSWIVRTFYTYGSSPTTISDGSSVSITNNYMSITNCSVGSNFYWYITNFNTGSGAITISSMSSFSVDKNTIVASDVYVTPNWLIYAIATATNAPLTITAFSTFSISNNTYFITNTTVANDWFFSYLLFATSSHLVVADSSKVSIENNTMNDDSMTCRYYNTIAVNCIGITVNITDSSAMNVSQNSHILSKVLPTASAIGGWLTVYGATISGQLHVVGNEFQSSEGNSKTLLFTVMDVQTISPFSLSGIVTISANSVLSQQYTQSSVLEVTSSISSSTAGLVTITNNIITGGHTLSKAILSSSGVTLTPAVYVCANVVNSNPCKFTVTAYRCTSTTITFANLLGCTETPTTSVTPSRASTQSRTPTSTSSRSHTTSKTHTSTPTPPSVTKNYPSATTTESIASTVTGSASRTYYYAHVDPSHTPSQNTATTTLPLYTQPPSNTPTSSLMITPHIPPAPTTTVRPRIRTQSRTPTSHTSLPTPNLQHSATITRAPTPTPSTTPTLPLPPPACNSSCADVVSVEVVPAGMTAAQAISAYWSSHNNASAAMQGCSAVRIPFDATFKGASALLLVRVGVGVNTTYPTGNVTFATSTADGDDDSGSGIVAVGASGTVGEGGVVVVSIRRVDASPLSSLSGTMTFPAGVLMCTPTATSSGPFVNMELEAPPTALGEKERIAIAAVSMASADLQTVAAIGLLRCTPGSDEDVESEAGVRALVPIALSGTCAGAVQGALVGVCVALLLSVTATCVVRAVRGVGWAQAAATTRCPSLMLSVWGFLQMGFVVCGARLLTAESGSGGGGGGGDAVLGGVGVVVGGVLPGVYVLLAWSVVSRRCYRLAQVAGAVAGRHGAVVWARGTWLPSYELDSDVYPASRAHSVVVGRTRRASPLWAGLSVIQPVVMLLVVFVQGSPCNVMLIVAGVVLAMVGCVHAVFRPHRVVAANYLQCVAMLLNACILFVASSLVRDPLNIPALDSNRAFAMLQVGLSVCRLLLSVGSFVYMRLYRNTVFTRANADGGLPSEEEASDSLPTPVFDVRGKCGGEMVLPLEVPPPTDDALDTGLLTKSKPKTNMKFSTAMKDFVLAERPNVLEEAHSDLQEELPPVPHQGATEGSVSDEAAGSNSSSVLYSDSMSSEDILTINPVISTKESVSDSLDQSLSPTTVGDSDDYDDL